MTLSLKVDADVSEKDLSLFVAHGVEFGGIIFTIFGGKLKVDNKRKSHSLNSAIVIWLVALQGLGPDQHHLSCCISHKGLSSEERFILDDIHGLLGRMDSSVEGESFGCIKRNARLSHGWTIGVVAPCELTNENIFVIDDIKRNKAVFTDGCGFIDVSCCFLLWLIKVVVCVVLPY
jgi:hypothetical protein